MGRTANGDDAQLQADIALSEDIEARLKVVKCTYTGGCNVWYYNFDDFCSHCPSNSEAKEMPDEVPRKAQKGVRHSGRGKRIKH